MSNANLLREMLLRFREPSICAVNCVPTRRLCIICKMGFAIKNLRFTQSRKVIFMVVFAVASGFYIHTLRGAAQQAVPRPAQAAPNPAPMFKAYCIGCHGPNVATSGINFEKLTTSPSIAENYQAWEKVISMLETKRMPPKGIPGPTDEQRMQTVSWIHAQLDAYIKAHAGDPGRVTVRRLTSGEYNYAIHDLTGLDLDLGIDASNDSVGGEGFTNFGDVQFMQDGNLQRYLEAAKSLADRAVIGAGPLTFSMPIPARQASRCPRFTA